MNPIPERPKIYHITHIRNLPQIIQQGVVWSDAKRIELGLDCEIVGMSEIKRRRLEDLTVKCHPDTMVGEYVPFYWCPRSIMLFLLHRANHPDLSYRGGQEPIVHLEADLRATVTWAQGNGSRWAFSDCNAGAVYADFFARLADLDKINWTAVDARDWRGQALREGKQAEFLLYESFPWHLVERIGVQNDKIKMEADGVLQRALHQPPVSVERTWYY